MSATALQARDELRARGITADSPDCRLVGGFTVVGGHGLGLPASAVCSVMALPAGVHLAVEIGEPKTATISYQDLTVLEVSGGARTTGGGFFGGGFGLQGAAEGMLIASALNAASKKTTINTGMHIGSVAGEALLHHGELSGDAIRQALSPLWTRYEAAKRRGAAEPIEGPDDYVALIARLGDLRDAGVLSEAEFTAKKTELLARI